MKTLKTAAFCALLTLSFASASAQLHASTKEAVRKPRLFYDLPQRMAINKQSLAPLLQKEIGENVSVPMAGAFTFLGKVVSKSDASETRSKTVVIKSTDRQGAALTITGIANSDGTYRYSGRMLSLKHSDAYEMIEEAGELQLQKKELTDLVSE
jgi:hypothetical protein